jgi:hypothetical protein
MKRWCALQVLLDSINGTEQQQQQQQGGSAPSPVLQRLPQWLAGTRQDLERALARVGAGTAAPAEAVGLWTKLAQVCCVTQEMYLGYAKISEARGVADKVCVVTQGMHVKISVVRVAESQCLMLYGYILPVLHLGCGAAMC